MKTSFPLLTLAALAALLSPSAHGDPLAVSTDLVYALDTIASPPRAVKTAADRAKTASYFAGDTVTATAPDGTVSTLVSDAGSDGTLALSALNAGGVWTLANSNQGTATFSVRHSLFGTLGDGTAASPAKLVDGDELVDYAAGDGYVFSLADGDSSLFAALAIPAGYRIEETDGGAWRLVTSANGLQYLAAEVSYPFDSQQPGPDRRTGESKTLPVAYSGDNWRFGSSAAATLTLTPPSGAATVMNLSGTGASPFKFTPGEWTVTLAMADGSTQSAVLNIAGDAFMMIMR